MHNINIAFAALLFFLTSLPATAATDLTTLDIDGFTLGMTVSQAKEKFPGLAIKEVKRGGVQIGFEARRGDVHVSFSSPAMGEAIFQVQQIKIYRDKPDPYPVYMEYVKKYGRPDYGGRQMMSVSACWGVCYGDNKKLEFSMTIVGFGEKPFPATLTLSDPKLDRANYNKYKEELEKKKK